MTRLFMVKPSGQPFELVGGDGTFKTAELDSVGQVDVESLALNHLPLVVVVAISNADLG